MGFFSREKKSKSSSWSLSDPPNVYTSRPPALPHRPASQQHQSPQPYNPPQTYPQQQPCSPPPQLYTPPPQHYPQQQYTQQYTPQNQHPYPHPQPSRPASAPTPTWPAPPPQPPPGNSAWPASMLTLTTAAAQAYEHTSLLLDDVMTRIDRDAISATEAGLMLHRGLSGADSPSESASEDEQRDRSGPAPRNPRRQKKKKSDAGSHFSKVEMYANSKLPLALPPLALYMPTWPLLCLAAQHSSQVYEPSPSSSSAETYAGSDWRAGTRAMRIKSVPMDHAHAIVFAIRGTSSFMDWAVNLHTAPASPEGFLDDAGNLCHAGFLSVARNMVAPVAARLRRLLEEDPGRAAYSLLITGHSAGGAIASLLYMHMLATSEGAGSELNLLAGCFKRIHCVTFGAPPVSLLPLEKPRDESHPRRLRKSLFLAFVNEGDPVVRADKAYVKSLLELLTRPPPERGLLPGHNSHAQERRRKDGGGRPALPRRRHRQTYWPVPACTLSNAGRIVVLRAGDPMAIVREGWTVEERLAEGTRAVTCKEEDLRGVVWGDPVCHMMGLYAGRIEALAVAAVMGGGGGR